MASLTRSTLLVGSMTFISRILGLCRDILLLGLFGASGAYDAFLVAFKIPNFMRRLSAEGAFSQAFVPVLAEHQVKSRETLQSFINAMAGTLGVVLLLIVCVGFLLAPVLIKIFAPGFEAGELRATLSVGMLRVTFPYVFFISMAAFLGSVLNAYRRFAAPAFGPVFLNLSLIVAAIYLAPHLQHPIMALAWGVLASGVLQLFWPLRFLKSISLHLRPRVDFRHPGVSNVVKLMVPALFGVSVVQINLMLDTLFASFLPIGSVSWLYAADRLMQFPLGVFGVALSTVALPSLARARGEGGEGKYQETLSWALKMVFIIGLPAAIGLSILAGPLLVTLFQYGAFKVEDVLMTLPCLVAFSLGLLAFILVKILANGFYARKEIKKPVIFATVALLVNIALNFMLIRIFSHVGLAMATAGAAYVNAALLFWGLYSKGIYRPRWNPTFCWQLLLANSAMGGFLYTFRAPLWQWFEWTIAARLFHLATLVLLGAGLYFSVLWVAGFSPNWGVRDQGVKT